MHKFNDGEMFCSKCLLHDTFWTGGNSWGIDHCPKCSNQATIMWRDMSQLQKYIAATLFDKWWLEKRIKKEN